MNLLSNLNDDQLALLGCAGALVSMGSLMCLSYYIGRARLRGGVARSLHVPAEMAPVLVEPSAAGRSHSSSGQRSAA
jgi:hypothetical protein